MPFVNFAALRARKLGRREEYSQSSTSQMSSLPPTEESLSAGSIKTIDSFVHPQVDTLVEEDNESYDPYLKPLAKERRARLANRLKKIPSWKKGPVAKEPASPSATADETTSDSPTSMKVVKASRGKFSPFNPPSFLDIPARLSPVRPPKRDDSVVFPFEEEPASAQTAEKERKYWNKVANQLLDNYNIVHVRTAETLLQLGNAHMRCEEYKEALTVFKGATRIFRKIYGGSHLSVAAALNNVGVAACRLNKTEPNLHRALEALNQSFAIRYQVLGPSHVDTIDTLNNMAGVYLHLGKLQEARQACFEVLTMRKAVFGAYHPSVAITAHALGGVCLRLSLLHEASKHYYSALDVYRKLCLNEDYPCVARLLSDVDRLGRVMSSMDYK